MDIGVRDPWDVIWDLVKFVFSSIHGILILLGIGAAIGWLVGRPRLWVVFPEDAARTPDGEEIPDLNTSSSLVEVVNRNRRVCKDCQVSIRQVDIVNPEGGLITANILGESIPLYWSRPGNPKSIEISTNIPGVVRLFSHNGRVINVPGRKSGFEQGLSCDDVRYNFHLEVTSSSAETVQACVSVLCLAARVHPILLMNR